MYNKPIGYQERGGMNEIWMIVMKKMKEKKKFDHFSNYPPDEWGF